MTQSELAQLELLAEVDALVDRLNRWADDSPAWQPADKCRALVRRLADRAASLRVRLDAPLVVATLGGTGTGKSALVNALVGDDVVRTGRSRPTTTRPTLLCRRGLTPEMLGIDPATVELVERDLPALRDFVLVDCPDPDTTEEDDRAADAHASGPSRSAAASNLARLRAILPKCDVLLVTATQQKYRSARVSDELLAAVPGARLIFVQTHADLDDDIRDDWKNVLMAEGVSGEGLPSPFEKGAADEDAASIRLPSPSGRGAGGEGAASSSPTALTPTLSQRERGPERESHERHSHHIFRVDSLQALADARAGLQPRGEFADLLDALTRQTAGAAGARIRRANFLDLTAATLSSCRAHIDAALPSLRQVRDAVDEQRGLLAARIADEMRAELLANRRQWENRLLGKTASRWGLSPFSLVLRAYQGIGGLVAGALLYRARTPAQMALWGALEGVRSWHKNQKNRQTDQSADRVAASGWDTAELRKAAIIVEGYAAEAGLDRRAAQWNTVAAEAEAAAEGFVARVSGELESLVAQLAQRHTGWFTRWRYEILLLAMLGIVLYRSGKNFFYDSWWAQNPTAVFGVEYYVSAGFWLMLWCLLLLWAFCGRLRRGLRGRIDQLAAGWRNAASATGIFGRIEADCRRVEHSRQELDAVSQDVDGLRRRLAENNG